MNAVAQTRRLTPRDFRKGDRPYVCLTAYSAPMARLLDPHVDLILVGDSVGMVIYGMPNTLAVSLEIMIAHGAAVVRGSTRACIVVDMPFGSYQESPGQAFRNATRIMQETGCGAVKLEGGVDMAETVRFLTRRGIPVCGHVGLMPQSMKASGLRARGRDATEAEQVLDDARSIAQAGAFAVVVEGTYENVARAITTEIAVPTIGIGASPACDGQILVSDDMLGLFTDFKPRFVRRYAELADDISQAIAAYADDVRARRFPAAEHCFEASDKSSGR